MADPRLALLADRYARGLLTRGELYEALTELGVPLSVVREAFPDPDLLAGLVEWQTAIAAGAHVVGGERVP